jgi:phosphoribosylamine-glycine ligase
MTQSEKKVNKVLVISDEWLAPSLSLNLQNEGCDVYIALKRATNILKGTIKRIPYSERLEFASGCDLIIYEDKSNKGESSELRKQGLSVIGGDKLTDKLELDRTWANNIARMSGVLAPEMFEVDSFEKIKEIITERGGKWVLKQQGKIDEIKGLNFVSKMPNSEDMLDFLPILENKWVEGVKKDFVLQEKVEGHEMAVGSFWNGQEFMKDCDGDELCYENWEHKSLFPGNLGESTGEQYTVIQLSKAKYSKIFSQTLDKCRELLKQIDYKGYFDINTIVTEKGAYFLEFTPRMGVPFTSGILEIHKSSWFDFLKAMADADQDKNLKYDENYCIISWLYTKPFPFVNSHKMTEIYESEQTPTSMDEIAQLMSFRMSNSEGILINFTKDFTKEDWKHIHPDAIRFKNGRLEIANEDGYVLTVSEQGKTVEEAGEKVNTILKKIIIPKSFWRNDFDKSNYHKCKDDLEKWGFIIKDREQKIQEEKLNKEKDKTEKKRKEVREALKKIIL